MSSKRSRNSTRNVPMGAVRALRLLAVSLLSGAFLAFSAAPAIGALTHPLKTTFGPLSAPSGIAIDATNGNVFVADAGSGSVEIFGPEGGAPVGVANSKINVPTEQGRLPVAIDNAVTSPSKGTLYVGDTPGHAVRKYTLNQLSKEYESAGELSASPAFGEPLAIAVDAKGNVFVGSSGNSPAVIEFSPTGAEVTRFEFDTTVGTVAGIAFDSAGNLYAQGHFGSGVWRIAANGSGEIEHGATTVRLAAGGAGVAVDQTTNSLYISRQKSVAQYDASCVPVAGECESELEFGVGTLGAATKLAVSPLNGDIYVSDNGNHDVAVFDGTPAIVADVTIEAATAVAQNGATLNGTITAAGGPAAVCQFQYTTKASFESKGFEGASTAPCSPGGPFTGTAKEPVEAEVSGLSAETPYVFRLSASNENGPSFSGASSLSTVGKPIIDASSISLITRDSATVNGSINPNGGPNATEETTYFFEYVSQADFEASGYAKAAKVPAGGAAIGSGTKDVEVAQNLTGLLPFTSYHFQIVAENEAGVEIGPDRIFTTYIEQAIGLPDGRAYEQVTAVDKNGSAPEKNSDQAASGGGSFFYHSRGGIPGGEGAQEFPDYIASRGTDWSTQGVLPSASLGSAANVLGWSEDLSRSYVVQAELPGEPATLFERDSATRSLQPIAEGEDLTAFNYVSTAADDSVALFESNTVLPPGGAVGPDVFNTYAWDANSGELSLAGVFNTGQAPTKGTLAGSNRPLSRNQFNQAHHTVSADGSRVFFTDFGTGQLYVRENPTQPQSALDAEKKCTEADLACTVQLSASQRTVADPKGKKPAVFMTATPDGSRAFFTSAGKLTDDASTGPNDEGNDLYRYDLTSDELIDVTPDATDTRGAEVQGVLGASEDGSYVYFAANGVLAEGATQGNCSGTVNTVPGSGACNLYLWHEGETAFVAPMVLDPGSYRFSDSANWLPMSTGEGENTARVSADGKTLLFRSSASLTAYESEGVPEFYLYSAPGRNLSCVSCNPSGAAPLAPSSLSGDGAGTTRPVLWRNLSRDGKRVFFQTPDKLVVSDTNGDAGCPVAPTGFGRGDRTCQDAYEWEANGTGSCHSESQNGGCLYLLSSGTSTEASYFADADVDGNDAFIFTGQPLVGQDKDRIVDIYDVRVGGGIASQNPPPPPVPCEGEACKGGVPMPPASQSAGSASFAGPGNQNPARGHKKRHHKKKRHKGKRHASGKHR